MIHMSDSHTWSDGTMNAINATRAKRCFHIHLYSSITVGTGALGLFTVFRGQLQRSKGVTFEGEYFISALQGGLKDTVSLGEREKKELSYILIKYQCICSVSSIPTCLETVRTFRMQRLA